MKVPKTLSKSHPAVTLTEFKGVLYLHLSSDPIQGAMRLSRPDEIVIDYVQCMMIWMLFKEKPANIVQLGLGSGALARFCLKHFPETDLTVVEINPNVIEACRSTFHLPADNKTFRVIEGCAYEFVTRATPPGTVDILQVDLYDAKAAEPLFDTKEFYQACERSLSPDGMMTINIFGEEADKGETLSVMSEIFDAVAWLPEVDGGNTVAIAFKKSPVIAFTELAEKANRIRIRTSLKSHHWVTGLKEWMES